MELIKRLIENLILPSKGAPTSPKSSANLQDDFNTETVSTNQNGVWSFFRNFVANMLASLSKFLSNNNQRETEGGSGTPRPIVSMLNTVVEALRSGNIQRLFDSIMDQFNQLSKWPPATNFV